jgi:hypothetical protein
MIVAARIARKLGVRHAYATPETEQDLLDKYPYIPRVRHFVISQFLRALSSADEGSLAAWARRSLSGRRVALCFHRVADRRREGELIPKLSMAAAEIDRLLHFFAAAAGPLTVSFDDGYRDSAEYVLSRAPAFPQLEWLFFVCPEKVERGAGFRWDLAETRREVHAETILFAPVDVPSENLRADLLRMAREPRFEMASVELCREIQRLPNAALGNHSNVHHRSALLTPEQFAAECEASTRDFERLFGPQRHFAFPFGIPGIDFGAEHVGTLRSLGRFLIWSTEPRPFHGWERTPGALLPRFAVDGTRSWKESVVHIAAQALLSRIRGPAPLEARQ